MAANGSEPGESAPTVLWLLTPSLLAQACLVDRLCPGDSLRTGGGSAYPEGGGKDAEIPQCAKKVAFAGLAHATWDFAQGNAESLDARLIMTHQGPSAMSKSQVLGHALITLGPGATETRGPSQRRVCPEPDCKANTSHVAEQ